MSSTIPADSLTQLQQIMQRHGVTCTPEQFHDHVNVTFHQFEAEVYDHEHQDMWQEVPRQIGLLVEDWLAKYGEPQRKLRLLDIGSGTGLATHSLLKSPLGRHIGSIDLLDTSPRMLEMVQRRAAAEWPIQPERHNGITSKLVALGKQYDWIITCSVLHHVPDTAAFARDVAAMQTSGGVFLHIQDPNGDYLNDPVLKERMAKAPTPEEPRFTPERVWRRVKRTLTGNIDPLDYILLTNRDLMAKGVIQTPLTVPEIYSITDIHANNGLGASIRHLREWLAPYDLVSQRAYGFFGLLPLHLSGELKQEEERLIAARELNGFHIGALWQRR